MKSVALLRRFRWNCPYPEPSHLGCVQRPARRIDQINPRRQGHQTRHSVRGLYASPSRYRRTSASRYNRGRFGHTGVEEELLPAVLLICRSGIFSTPRLRCGNATQCNLPVLLEQTRSILPAIVATVPNLASSTAAEHLPPAGNNGPDVFYENENAASSSNPRKERRGSRGAAPCATRSAAVR